MVATLWWFMADIPTWISGFTRRLSRYMIRNGTNQGLANVPMFHITQLKRGYSWYVISNKILVLVMETSPAMSVSLQALDHRDLGTCLREEVAGNHLGVVGILTFWTHIKVQYTIYKLKMLWLPGLGRIGDRCRLETWDTLNTLEAEGITWTHWLAEARQPAPCLEFP